MKTDKILKFWYLILIPNFAQIISWWNNNKNWCKSPSTTAFLTYLLKCSLSSWEYVHAPNINTHFFFLAIALEKHVKNCQHFSVAAAFSLLIGCASGTELAKTKFHFYVTVNSFTVKSLSMCYFLANTRFSIFYGLIFID